jgi:hypothetical protein
MESASIDSATGPVQWIPTDHHQNELATNMSATKAMTDNKASNRYRGVAEEEEFDEETGASNEDLTALVVPIDRSTLVEKKKEQFTSPVLTPHRNHHKIERQSDKATTRLDVKRIGTPSASTETPQAPSLPVDNMPITSILSASSTESDYFEGMKLHYTPYTPCTVEGKKLGSIATPGNAIRTTIAPTMLFSYDEESIVPHAELVRLNDNKDYQGLDQKNLEKYLSDEEFQHIFMMNKVSLCRLILCTSCSFE